MMIQNLVFTRQLSWEVDLSEAASELLDVVSAADLLVVARR